MILGSIYVTLGALIIGVPIGIGCAVYLSEIASPKLSERQEDRGLYNRKFRLK